VRDLFVHNNIIIIIVGLRLLLITRKSYTGSRLTPNSMTLDDLERQNRGFYGFSGDFGLRNISRANCAEINNEINMDKLRMKFSALNIDFDGPSLDFLCSRKPAHESIKERYPRKSRWPVFRENGCRSPYRHAAYHNKHY